MRNFYLFEEAMRVDSVQMLEEGLYNLNEICINKDDQKDNLLCNSTIWECDTTQGIIYEMFGGVVNPELQRLIPHIFKNFTEQEVVFNNSFEFDAFYPIDCNAFTGINFLHTDIELNRRVFDLVTFRRFVSKCLKFGIINSIDELAENLFILYGNFSFTRRSLNDILYWKDHDDALYHRLFELFDDIPINPFMGGLGQTEVLAGAGGIASKRLNQEHRVTYKLEGNSINILTCRGHYD